MNKYDTKMREAFINAKFPAGFSETPLCSKLVKAAQDNAGVINQKKDWNAKLSYKTANKLKGEGIL